MSYDVKTLEFVHLKSRSTYSLSEGSLKVKDLVKLAERNQFPALALTDNNNLFAALEFSKECVASKIQPIIGINLNLLVDDQYSEIILYAKDEKGYSNLLELTSKSYLENMVDGKNHIKLEDLQNYNKGLISLTGGIKGHIGKLFLQDNKKLAGKFASDLKEIFGDRLYIEITRLGYKEEEKIEEKLLDLAYEKNIPIVATNEIFYSIPENYEAQDALICIADSAYVMEENRRKLTSNHYFKSQSEIKALFADLPEALENSVNIAKRCHIKSETYLPMLPNFFLDSEINEEQEFIKLSSAGLEERLSVILDKIDNNEERASTEKIYKDRLDFELNIITKMNFSGYFLIVSDFIKWSKNNGIPVGPGRGSGAGSVVAWSLSITELDPIKFGLLFERFLNPERISMPDFDIDFCQERRDEVINYVCQKYGKDKVAQIITFGKLQPRAVLRDVGRVLQMPYSQVDKISKMIPFNPVNPLTLSEAVEVEPELKKSIQNDPEIKKLISISLKLEGLNRHTSTHAAGIIICGRRITEIVPLYKDEKSNLAIVQYSMKYAEMSGLVKFDFLGLKTLTVIDKTLKYINKNGEVFSLDNINYQDKASFSMLSRGESSGVFQFESVGMKDALRKLQPDHLNDIIALGALYRPGPMDNIPRYISCKHNLEKPDYLHPKLEDLLKETFGVIIYQEQVMEIAKILADYSLGDADLLRRAMGKKIKEEMDDQRKSFTVNAVKNGLTDKRANEIFDLVAKFAGYGFNKAHAAAYGVISYQTAYLKANYTIEFLTATLNLDIHDTDKLSLFCEEAKHFGIKIVAPSINDSEAHFTIEKDDDGEKFINYGMGALKGVSIAAIEEMVKERKLNGKFENIRDFVCRSGSKIINKKQLESLIKAGAFDKLYNSRKDLFDSVENILKFNHSAAEKNNSEQISLFNLNNNEISKLDLLNSGKNWGKIERLNYELEVMGFYFNEHPISDLMQYLAEENISSAKDLEKKPDGFFDVKMVAVAISNKTRMSPRGRYVSAQLSDPTGLFEISIFDDNLLERTRDLIASKEILLIEGEARKSEGGVRINAKNIKLLNDILTIKKSKIQIYCEENINISCLKDILKNNDNSRTKITLTIISGDEEIIIELPGSYSVNADMLNQLKEIKSIRKICYI